MIIRETSEHLPLKKLGFWHSIFNIVVEISDVPNMEHKHNIMLNWLLVEFIPPNLYIMIGKVKMDSSLFCCTGNYSHYHYQYQPTVAKNIAVAQKNGFRLEQHLHCLEMGMSENGVYPQL